MSKDGHVSPARCHGDNARAFMSSGRRFQAATFGFHTEAFFDQMLS